MRLIGRKDFNKKIIICMTLFSVLLGLIACAKEENANNSTRQKQGDIELGGNSAEENRKYMYGFSNGTLVLRTENYTDVIDASIIDESERESLGFWEVETTDASQVHNGEMFKIVTLVDGNSYSGEAIVRYDLRGIKTEMYRTDGSLRLITCENDCLYFYENNNENETESFYRLNNCFSKAITVECLAEIPVADDINDNSGNILFKNGEWIYFLYTDEPETIAHDFYYTPTLWLYRLSEKTGLIERVEEVYNSLNLKCRGLSDILKYEDYYVLEGLDKQPNISSSMEDKSYLERIFYLYDPSNNSCKLLCETAMSGSVFFVDNGYGYHIHRDVDEKIYWARTAIDGYQVCEKVSEAMSEDCSHFDNLSSVIVCEESFFYSCHGDSAYKGYYVNTTKKQTQEMCSPVMNIVKYYHDGILYLYLNGAVLYTDNDHYGMWYDSGIRFSPKISMIARDSAFFKESNGKVFFITKNNLATDNNNSHSDYTKEYTSLEVNTVFSEEVAAESPLFNPNQVRLKPDELTGCGTPDYSKEDRYGNVYCLMNELNKNSSNNGVLYDISFISAKDHTSYAKYNTYGRYKYMAAVVGVDILSSNTKSGYIKIYADERVIYESPLLTRESEPIELFLAIENANVVKVVAYSDDGVITDLSYDGVNIILDDVTFQNVSHPLYLRFLTRKEDLNLSEEAKMLASKTWYWQGFRMSDSWTFIFYDTGKYLAMNEAGGQSQEGTYSLSGDTLNLYGDMESVFKYDDTTGWFISTTAKRIIKQDYVDENGVYHEPAYEYITLSPKE